MLRLKYVKNQFQKRTLRVNYSQTKATPMDSELHSTIGSGASFTKPANGTTVGSLARTADAHSYKNGLVPGLVMIRAAGDTVAVAHGGNDATRPYGLLANFVGGDFDELGDEKKVGVWRGVGSEYTILAPAFDDTGLAAAYAAATAGNPVKLYAGIDGRLVANGAPGNRIPIANLVERVSNQVIRIDLLV